MNYAVRSDVGLVRSNNQDSYLANGSVFAVADGMGGHQGGETASRLALHAIHNALFNSRPNAERLRQSVDIANRRVYSMSREVPELNGMGTTVSILWPDRDCIHIAHVGDSRIYLLREGKLTQLTADHSYVAELVRKGELSKEEARVHPYRNIITRAVGTDSLVESDVQTLSAMPGDRYLICSDGLYSMVEDSDLESILTSEGDLEELADRLLALALEHGGTDNITLILMEGGEPV